MNSVRTTKRTPHFTITKINWLTLFKEITTVYSKNHKYPVLQIYKAADTYSYHSASLNEGDKLEVLKLKLSHYVMNAPVGRV
jgi:hypothetical protein